MGMFDNMTESLFKENKDGTITYYAKGLLRKGYIIDAIQKERLYKFHKRIFKYLLPLGIVYSMLLGLAGVTIEGLIPIFIVTIIVYLRQQKLIKELHTYDERLTVQETKKTIANAFPKSFIIFMMINGFLAITLALMLPWLVDDTMENVGAIIGLLLIMGVPLLGIGWYFYKNKER